jgi:hypothetical protein
MSKVEAVAATIVFLLGASVAHGQSLSAADQERNRDAAGVFNQTPYGQSELANRAAYLNAPTSLPPGTPPANRPMYVACWAEVPSHNTAYFSATFAAPAVNSVRKEFREFVTTQYGPVSKLQCAGKFSETVVNELVERWKDSARTTKNAIVDT